MLCLVSGFVVCLVSGFVVCLVYGFVVCLVYGVVVCLVYGVVVCLVYGCVLCFVHGFVVCLVLSLSFEFERLFNALLTAEVISWRGRPDNVVTVGFGPKNSSSAGGALNHCTTGPPQPPGVRARGGFMGLCCVLFMGVWCVCWPAYCLDVNV